MTKMPITMCKIRKSFPHCFVNQHTQTQNFGTKQFSNNFALIYLINFQLNDKYNQNDQMLPIQSYQKKTKQKKYQRKRKKGEIKK